MVMIGQLLSRQWHGITSVEVPFGDVNRGVPYGERLEDSACMAGMGMHHLARTYWWVASRPMVTSWSSVPSLRYSRVL